MYRCCLIIYLNLLLFMYVCGVLCVPKNIIKPKLKSAEVKLDYKYINLACLNFFLSLNSVLFHRITDHQFSSRNYLTKTLTSFKPCQGFIFMSSIARQTTTRRSKHQIVQRTCLSISMHVKQLLQSNNCEYLICWINVNSSIKATRSGYFVISAQYLV